MQPTWPPSEPDLAWRPAAAAPGDSVSGWQLADDDDTLPSWVPVPAGGFDDLESVDIPAHVLATIETDAGRPGGGGISVVYAVPAVDGRLRIVITNDDDLPFESPLQDLESLPTLGELLQILDETEIEGEDQVWGVGHPTRENSDDEHREDLRGFVTIRSGLYPQLEPLDQSRLDQWIAERP